MDLNARVDVNCERTDGQKTRRLYRTLLKQVRQKSGPLLEWFKRVKRPKTDKGPTLCQNYNT